MFAHYTGNHKHSVQNDRIEFVIDSIHSINFILAVLRIARSCTAAKCAHILKQMPHSVSQTRKGGLWGAVSQSRTWFNVWNENVAQLRALCSCSYQTVQNSAFSIRNRCDSEIRVWCVCVFFFSWYIYILIRDIRRLRCRERRQSPGGTTVSLFTTGVTNTHVCSHLTNVLACTEPYAKECYSNNLLADVCVCACRFVFVFIRLE